MVIVKLKGGLGNQMFQYAFGLALSKRLKTSLKLDISHFNQKHPEETPREYELDIFSISNCIASPIDLLLYNKPPKKSLLYLVYKWKSLFYKSKVIQESTFNIAEKLELESFNSIYLDGYWQSEIYFSTISELITQSFVFKNQPSLELETIIEEIKLSNSVSIHFRRGDYVTNQNANKHHGVCDLEFYHKAIDFIATQIQDPTFFVFSDDISWVTQNLKISFPHRFVENKPSIHHSEDMRLMSLCKHNIIANSSYSWWGAWLNKNPQKIIIAPKQWLRDSTSIYSKDIIPAQWIKL